MMVVVAGATGPLGVRLVARLVAEGHRVRILTRRPFLAATRFGAEADIQEWHPGHEPAPVAALAGASAVIHLMGAPLAAPAAHLWADPLERIRATRTASIERLITGLGGRPVRLIIASVAPTSEVAGAVLTEASAGEAPASQLRSAVLAWEAAAQAARATGVSVAIVRLGLILAPGGALQTLVRLAGLGLRPDLAGRIVPAIDVEDAAAMLSGLVARPDVEGPINGVAPEPMMGADLAQLLAGAQRVPMRLWAPRRVLQRRIGPLAPLLLNRARIVPQRLIEMGAGFEHPDPKASAQRAIEALLAAPRQPRLPWLRRAETT